MKKNTAILTSFIGGAVAGGLICFAVLKDKYDMLLAEEIEEMKKYFQKEIEDIDDDHFREMQDLVGELDDEERTDRKYVDYVKKYSSPEDLVDLKKNYIDNDIKITEKMYNDYHIGVDLSSGIDETSYHNEEEESTYGEDYDSTDDIDELDLSDDEREEFEQWDEHYAVDQDLIKRNDPYVISQEEFDQGNAHFDKITLSYYDIDDVLADERDEVIPRVDDVIGRSSLTEFGSQCDDDRIVHVRNERYGADYEVILTGECYIESVLGIPYETGKHMIKRRDKDE